MKAYLCILSLLSALVLVQCGVNPQMAAVINECKEEFGLTEESLSSINFEDPKIQCFAACVVEKEDRLTDGKLSIDKEVEAASRYMPDKIDETLRDKMTECVNEANEEKGECAVSGTLFKCIAEKFGIHP